MKVWKKLKVVVLTMLFCIGVMVQPALAATMVQDGIEATLTTDKENYQQGEEITVTLMVTNTNRTEATNVSLETFLPDHFVVAENNETAKQVIANNGMKIALWNVDTEDWKVKNAQKIKETIVNKAFDGAVILIHDIHTFTIDGLEMALEELSRNGYQFVTLETLSQYKELKNVIK